MEELEEEDVKLVTDSEELQEVIAILQREIVQLESLYQEEKKQLLRKRQREIAAKRSLVMENADKSVDKKKVDDVLLARLMATKNRFLAELKVIHEMKPSGDKISTIINLNLEKELKETSEHLKTLVKVTEEQGADLRATLERLDVTIDRDKKIAEALQTNLDEKMQKLATNPAESAVRRIRVLKSNVRKVKRCTTEMWDKLAEFLHICFPSVPRNENVTNEQNGSMRDENGRLRRYVQLSEMIQQLMNAHMTDTDSSYLKIDKTWYPGYVKMLLGRGICIQHPQRPDHIKLEAYL